MIYVKSAPPSPLACAFQDSNIMAKRGTKARKPANARSESPVKNVSEEDCVSGSDNEDAKSLHSDALDEQSDDSAGKAETQKKRRRALSSLTRTPSSKRKPVSARADPKSKQGVSEKKTPARKKRKVVEDTAEDERDSDVVELKNGQEVVGKVVEAPTTGWGAYGLAIRRPCL